MTECEEIYKASVRDRRRIVFAFALVLAIVAITLETGWLLSAIGRDSWAAQALTWQSRYIELYDQYAADTNTGGASRSESVRGSDGLACPEGYTAQTGWISVSTEPTGSAKDVLATLCFLPPE